MSDFTPGPWECSSESVGKGAIAYFVRREGGFLALAVDIIDPLADAPSEANARLIAAAPDLLAACQATAEHLSRLTDPCLRCDGNRELLAKAIAKATGGDA